MSDSYSAPVSNERLEKLIKTMTASGVRVSEHLEGSVDSIVLHNLADEFDGLARDLREVVQASIDDMIPPECPDCGTQSIEEAIGQVCNTCKRGVIR